MITLPFFAAWIVMLVLGAAGHQLHNPKFYIGYWPVFLVLIAISIIGWIFRGGKSNG